MKFAGLVSVLSVAACGFAAEASGTARGVQKFNGTENGSVSTNFCKMDKDEMIGSSCELTFEEINSINAKVRQNVVDLVQTDFFKYFKLDLYKKCPFWDDNNALCVNRACAVDVVEDWDSLPEYWQPEALGQLEKDSENGSEADDDEFTFLDQLCSENKKASIPSKDIEDYDYCDIEDFSKEHSVLVDLSKNPERFTGYGGEQSGQIWSSIYGENCFSANETGQSLAKDAFYRLVSGLHASIGTHLSNDYLNTETGKWEPNLELFMARVGNFPDRVSNIYLNYAIVAKALYKIKPYLDHLEFCNSYNEDVKSNILNIISQLDSKLFNEDLIFADDFSNRLKDDFRIRFKNVTTIMDCVHCDRCRMWGKVQTTGYGTSLKILFELDEQDEEKKQFVVNKLTKYELIALFNTFDRLSKSVESINNFEKLYNQKYNDVNGLGKLASIFDKNNFFRLINKAGKHITESMQELNKSLNASINENSNDIKKDSKKDKLDKKEFKDLKMPEKKKSSSENPENIWVKAWHNEMHNLKEAFSFIYKSYYDLPRNLSKLILSRVIKLWNKFVGIANYLNEVEDDVVYKLNIH